MLASGISLADLGRHADFIYRYSQYRLVMVGWTIFFLFTVLQWVLSWADKPVRVSQRQLQRLDRLRVTVSVPVYNEDPGLLDRCIFSLLNQNRLPDRIDVVDDGSHVDYSELRRHYEGVWPGRTLVTWRRQRNAGKKHAQVNTFLNDRQADIFVTIDSDTFLPPDGLDEGLKPFINRSVMSVAGIELAINAGKNWLTRSVSSRSLFFQIVACGAQSTFGDILVNRGAYALYRAELVRRVVPAYIGETFLGRPVRLGDDAALTLFARMSGKAVQQSTAFAFTVYPEKLSHHFRQWIRWMRGSTIRNCWRVRYLPIRSFSWWFTVLSLQTFITSPLVLLLAALNWPLSETFAEQSIAFSLVIAYLVGLRMFSIRRSDQSIWFQIGTYLIFPAANLWGLLVLRPLRFYGIATFLRQGWNTRATVEVPMGEVEPVSA